VGLIARQLEAAGIPTVCLTSARDITRSVNPPRSVFLDYPLGHTSGRANEPELNQAIVGRALEAFDELTEPGSMVHLPYSWAESDDWKDYVMRPRPVGEGDVARDGDSTEMEDDRVARFDTPQYQSQADAEAAASTHADVDCLVCAGIDF